MRGGYGGWEVGRWGGGEVGMWDVGWGMWGWGPTRRCGAAGSQRDLMGWDLMVAPVRKWGREEAGTKLEPETGLRGWGGAVS